jgi:polar amino acid transport system ATP-binding protein
MIKVEHLKKEYPNVTPLRDVSVEIHDGDVISIIGPSGTGKSTLMRCISLLEKPTSGKIYIDGVEITDPKTNIDKVRMKMGMVFQSFNLFGHLTVIENIMMAPVDLLGRSKQEAYDEAMRLLRMVGLVEKADNYPDELSGGQKQRIAIARTLAMNPDIIFFDEPTSALDPTMVGEVQSVIRDLAKTGKTMMIVTHEMAFAQSICNRVFYMDKAGIYEDGSPEQIFEHPLHDRTRQFVRRLKVLELEIKSRDYDFRGVVGQIEEYCRKNHVDSKLTYRIQLCFEEIIQEILMKNLENPLINVVVEYSEAEEKANMIMRFNGPELDESSIQNELSYAMLARIVRKFNYDQTNAEEYPNRFVFEIDNKSVSR